MVYVPEVVFFFKILNKLNIIWMGLNEASLYL